MKYKKLTGKIFGCTMEVHSTLGNGFPGLGIRRVEFFVENLISVETKADLKMDDGNPDAFVGPPAGGEKSHPF